MAKLRIYTDTSVIGGCFDKEFAEGSLRLVEFARSGRVILLLSAVVVEELEDAPSRVRDVLSGLPRSAVQVVAITPEVTRLRDAYIQARVVGVRWTDDATHVAAASISEADAIVSWNFRHIVRLDKIKAYNAVNRRLGYRELTIVTPAMVDYEKEKPNE